MSVPVTDDDLLAVFDGDRDGVPDNVPVLLPVDDFDDVPLLVLVTEGVPDLEDDGVLVCEGVCVSDGVGRTQLVSVTDPGVPSAPSTVLRPIALPSVDEITITVFT